MPLYAASIRARTALHAKRRSRAASSGLGHGARARLPAPRRRAHVIPHGRVAAARGGVLRHASPFDRRSAPRVLALTLAAGASLSIVPVGLLSLFLLVRLVAVPTRDRRAATLALIAAVVRVLGCRRSLYLRNVSLRETIALADPVREPEARASIGGRHAARLREGSASSTSLSRSRFFYRRCSDPRTPATGHHYWAGDDYGFAWSWSSSPRRHGLRIVARGAELPLHCGEPLRVSRRPAPDARALGPRDACGRSRPRRSIRPPRDPHRALPRRFDRHARRVCGRVTLEDDAPVDRPPRSSRRIPSTPSSSCTGRPTKHEFVYLVAVAD